MKTKSAAAAPAAAAIPAPRSVGVFEAKTKLSELLEIVRQGAEVTITRHGLPVAKIVPVGERKATWAEASQGIRELRAKFGHLRKNYSPAEIVAMIKEGRDDTAGARWFAKRR
jgi:prevent-host-death family protein